MDNPPFRCERSVSMCLKAHPFTRSLACSYYYTVWMGASYNCTILYNLYLLHVLVLRVMCLKLRNTSGAVQLYKYLYCQMFARCSRSSVPGTSTSWYAYLCTGYFHNSLTSHVSQFLHNLYLLYYLFNADRYDHYILKDTLTLDYNNIVRTNASWQPK